MPNSYYTRTMNPQPTQRVGSNDLKSEFQSVEGGFDEVAADMLRTLKVPATTTDQLLNLTPASRANLVLAFDASGNPTAIAYGRYRGDWVTGTAYVVSDYFRDPTTKNIYAVVLAHTAGVLVDDLAANKALLAINVADVELAKTQAQSAAVTATAQAVIATTQADAARAIANFVGIWASLTGPLNKPATVHHAGKFWVLVNNLADVTLSEPGVSVDWLEQTGGGIESVAYNDRATLRSLTPSANELRLVDGLGLFVFAVGSDEPDDDESCFATSNGRWLLQAAHWDLVDAWQLPDDAVRDEDDEDESLRFAAKVLTGSATCAITSLSNSTATSFTGTVTGAYPGDRVIATPPGELGSTGADTSRLGYYAWVSAANTVTVTLINPSASTASTNAAVRTAWPITVIKS